MDIYKTHMTSPITEAHKHVKYVMEIKTDILHIIKQVVKLRAVTEQVHVSVST